MFRHLAMKLLIFSVSPFTYSMIYHGEVNRDTENIRRGERLGAQSCFKFNKIEKTIVTQLAKRNNGLNV